MSKEEIPEANKENNIEKQNPNSIGEMLSIGRDLLTQPDKVYRSVATEAAIQDLENSGVVRNKQSAGLTEKSRWGEKVFWSKGKEGGYHGVQANGFVIEAPLSVAQERIVTKEDVTAVYTKNESGEVFNVWKERQEEAKASEQQFTDRIEIEDAEKLAEIRRNLGIEG